MAAKGVKQADVARHFKIKPPSVSDWLEHGRIGKNHIEKLVSYFSDVAPLSHWGLSGIESGPNTDNYEFIRSQTLIGVAGDGDEPESQDIERIEDELAFKRSYFQKRKLRSKNLRIGQVEGLSMYPKLDDGETVVYDISQRDIVSNKIYAIVGETKPRYKKLQKTGNTVLIVSENQDPQYQPPEAVSLEDAQRMIIGRLVWHCGDM